MLPGVTWLVTGRHAGYYPGSEVNARIFEDVRRAGGYYERDLDAALCVYFVLLRGAFAADVLVVIKVQYPEFYARLIGGRVEAPSGGPWWIPSSVSVPPGAVNSTETSSRTLARLCTRRVPLPSG